jgi:hypothetical protein
MQAVGDLPPPYHTPIDPDQQCTEPSCERAGVFGGPVMISIISLAIIILPPVEAYLSQEQSEGHTRRRRVATR